MTGVSGSHHVLGVKHLLSQLGHRDGAVRSGPAASQGRKADHEKVQTREGNHVDGQLAQVRVELTGETETGRDARHDDRDEVVQVAVGRSRELQGTEANVVQRFIVDTEGLVRVFDELVHRESGVVGLDDSVGHLRVSLFWVYSCSAPAHAKTQKTSANN